MPCRLDRMANVGDRLLYEREEIPSTLAITDLSIEGVFVEMKFLKKWLFYCFYNPKKSLIANQTKTNYAHLNPGSFNLVDKGASFYFFKFFSPSQKWSQ